MQALCLSSAWYWLLLSRWLTFPTYDMGRKSKAGSKSVTATTSNALVKKVVAAGLASKRNKRKQ
jgi:hypothetical protein